MKTFLPLVILALFLVFNSCCSGNKTKTKNDSIAKVDSATKSITEVESWSLYKLYTDNFQKANEQNNAGKKFKVKNLIVNAIHKSEDGSTQLDCFAYNVKDASFTQGKSGKSVKYIINGKELKPIEFSFVFSVILANTKDADGLKPSETNETVHTYYSIITMEGEMTETGGNYLAFGKCKVVDKNNLLAFLKSNRCQQAI